MSISVDKLIEVLQKNVKPADRKTYCIEFWLGNQELEIESIGYFTFSSDILFSLKKKPTPILKRMTFKAEHKKMIAKKEKEINKPLLAKNIGDL